MERRLYRSRTESMISGVAGGVAEWLNMDPSLVRILWIILVPLTGGLALLVYLVMIFVVPEASVAEGEAPPSEGAAASPGGPPVPPPPPRVSGVTAPVVIGLGLVLLGSYFLVRAYLPPIPWDRLWPITLVVVGALILFTATRTRN